ncbi:MAG TPA: hypothetical protein VJ256_04415, partial [Dehalococcoidia bacterium]|nr:hypothetical protein [Dehalococcoidia bacterium]
MLGVARPVAVGSAARGPLRALARLWRWLFPHPIAPVLSTVVLVLLVALGLTMSWIVTGRITAVVMAEVVDEAQLTAGRIIVAQALSPEDMAAAMAGDRYVSFDASVRGYILNKHVVQLKIWDPQGTIIYSTDRSQVGQRYPIEGDMAMALAGRSAGHLSAVPKEENEAERLYGRLLEVYVPLIFPGSVEPAGALELYHRHEPLVGQIREAQRRVFLWGGLLEFGIWLVISVVGRQMAATVARRERDLVQSGEGIRLFLLQVVDVRDHGTAGHSQRVRSLSIILGQQMGLSEKELVTLRR